MYWVLIGVCVLHCSAVGSNIELTFRNGGSLSEVSVRYRLNYKLR